MRRGARGVVCERPDRRLPNPLVMPFIAFLGCDGSGKSAVIRQTAALLRADGVPVACGHWRPTLFARHKTGDAWQMADDPHNQDARGIVGSVAKLVWLWFNWWGGWVRWLRRARAEGVVLFDRYHADLLVDPVRYRYGGSLALARLASRLMPQPDLVCFLDAPPDVLLARKQEVAPEALRRARDAYLRLARSHPRFRVIDASRPLEQVVGEVIDLMQGPAAG